MKIRSARSKRRVSPYSCQNQFRCSWVEERYFCSILTQNCEWLEVAGEGPDERARVQIFNQKYQFWYKITSVSNVDAIALPFGIEGCFSKDLTNRSLAKSCFLPEGNNAWGSKYWIITKIQYYFVKAVGRKIFWFWLLAQTLTTVLWWHSQQSSGHMDSNQFWPFLPLLLHSNVSSGSWYSSDGHCGFSHIASEIKIVALS